MVKTLHSSSIKTSINSTSYLPYGHQIWHVSVVYWLISGILSSYIISSTLGVDTTGAALAITNAASD